MGLDSGGGGGDGQRATFTARPRAGPKEAPPCAPQPPRAKGNPLHPRAHALKKRCRRRNWKLLPDFIRRGVARVGPFNPPLPPKRTATPAAQNVQQPRSLGVDHAKSRGKKGPIGTPSPDPPPSSVSASKGPLP